MLLTMAINIVVGLLFVIFCGKTATEKQPATNDTLLLTEEEREMWYGETKDR